MPAPAFSRALEGLQVYCPKCLRFLPTPPRPDPAKACVPVDVRCRVCGWHGFAQFHRPQAITHEAILQADDLAYLKLVKK